MILNTVLDAIARSRSVRSAFAYNLPVGWVVRVSVAEQWNETQHSFLRTQSFKFSRLISLGLGIGLGISTLFAGIVKS